MRTFGWLALIGALGISAVVGCGGNVVVDGPGGGSEGGGGTTGGTTTPTVFNPGSYCSFVCGEADLAGCLDGGTVGECQQACVDVFDQYAGCQAELKAYYDCVVAELPESCGGAEVCVDEVEVFVNCGGDAG